ncbi:hypothetical protein ACP4OV_012302 [Aristida adscensionis]
MPGEHTWLLKTLYGLLMLLPQEEYEKLIFPLAICIVVLGIYEDVLDKADEIIYTSQGGNDLLSNHRQIGSQQLKRGNLALKVVDDWVQNGVHGHVVFKYKLKRLEGQPSLTTSEL